MRRRPQADPLPPTTTSRRTAATPQSAAAATHNNGAVRHPPADADMLVDAGGMIRRTLAGMSAKASAGEITDATMATLRAEYPGWDYQTLHQEVRDWLDADPARTDRKSTRLNSSH